MKVEEAMKLKPGDLVMIRWKNASTIYKDLVYEIVEPPKNKDSVSPYVIVKQPHFDMGFRMSITTRQIKRYEDVLKEEIENE